MEPLTQKTPQKEITVEELMAGLNPAQQEVALSELELGVSPQYLKDFFDSL
ncbi:MAG: hypothetical protein RR951_11230 [Ruthenibacterium sp.]